MSFVYCWTDHKTNKLYIGSHKGSIDDGYVCSSKPMLKQYKLRPDDFTRQIVAEGSHEDCRALEAKILDSVNAKMDESFYNMHNGNGEFYWKGPRGSFSAEHKEKLAAAKRGRKISKEHAEKLHAGRKNSKNSPEHAAAVKASRVGSKHSEEAKKKMSETRRQNPRSSEIGRMGGLASAVKRKSKNDV